MKSFADLLITWHAKSGRHHLPWQQSKDPYNVWVSEIMLQQTQVAIVIDYYHRFMKKFPTIKALADADEEEVMQLWSGLGYYRRARFLHEGAQMIMEEMEGVFPSQFDMMMKIPGIGRSTAGAISAFSFNQKKAILDGNVKRVLSRYFLVREWTGLPKTEKKLWGYAESLLPDKNIATYTQALMDLGATVCSKKTLCETCPLKKHALHFRRIKCIWYQLLDLIKKFQMKQHTWSLLNIMTKFYLLRDLREVYGVGYGRYLSMKIKLRHLKLGLKNISD